ncbi:uncharacterized protein LOC124927437 [Impatiens glandulifera]|uniref:uncharacterized protein LOC124927437 n=1 Tax=Impatiens glandulifera TaxID=253017 RepID=UPI001FB0F7AB|nr:uncharacterized protein LOC124927437 [Impatiens glandulifera]
MSSDTTPELADNSGIATIDDVNQRKIQNPILSLFPNLPIFNFLFQNQDSTKQETTTPAKEETKQKPSFVKLPSSLPIVPSLKLEEGEESEQPEQTNPVVLWQVYALGGVLVLKWIISRWKERRSRNKPPPPGDDDLS